MPTTPGEYINPYQFVLYELVNSLLQSKRYDPNEIYWMIHQIYTTTEEEQTVIDNLLSYINEQ